MQEETGWNDYGARMYMSDIWKITHASIFLGKSRNGTEYNFSKNGFYGKPTIETTGDLKKEFGHKVGYWNYRKK